jgi:exopolysaccharide biosynthesis protein
MEAEQFRLGFAVRCAILLALLVAGADGVAAAQSLPSSVLAVKHDGEWREIWRSDEAPERWTRPHPDLVAAVEWLRVDTGIERAEISLTGTGSARRFGLILVRMDPGALEMSLAEARRAGGTLGAWSIDAAPAEAALAINAGQFQGGRPWGWVVREGFERQPPGEGSLGMAIVVDVDGGARLVVPDSIPAVRARGRVRDAFQSYPMLLSAGGRVPGPLQAPGQGVDVAHRDSRVALGQLPDGRLLIAVTRFDVFGGVLGGLPVGPTTPEMAALMGALGCVAAVALDGGLSGQLLVREPSGTTLSWPGVRRVPLGLVALPRR